MTAQEMLIEVNTSLQAIGASRTRKYYPQEIEWYLNKIQVRFIQDCVRKKGSEASGYRAGEPDSILFEVDEMYRDAIKALLKETYLPVNYANSSGLNAAVFLPTDYSYLLDLGVSADLCTTFRYSQLVTQNMRVVGFPYPADSTDGAKHYFSNLTLSRDSDTIYNRPGWYDYPSAFQVVEEVQGVYTLPDTSVIQVTADIIGNVYKAGYILMLVPDDGATYALSYESTSVGSVDISNFIWHNSGKPEGQVNIPARSVINTNTFNSGTTPYYRTSNKEVTTKLNGSVMIIDTATNFIVNGIVLSYIRKPRRISVSLNIGSEIAPEFHNQMCDMVVSHIRERIGDPKYQTGLIDAKQ